MDSAYDRKFEEMKKYIPFLESMIKRLESTNLDSNPRQAQLDKIRSLRDLLMDKKKRMKMENLLKCEQVLVNLYAKVEQRDALPGLKIDDTLQKEKTDLNKVRSKLKSVVSKLHQETVETLPEIARASDTEEVCVPGSKEPALFQRRPNIFPTTSTYLSSDTSKESLSKRNYTRVLLSPEPSEKVWPANEPPSSDKQLFSRRSPKKSPRKRSPSYYKKERKKNKSKYMQSSKVMQDLNITLNVPEDSLNSLNTRDILSRIINCSDNDVDIATLRELRTQILGELKETGANDDISDIILKSYKKKDKKGTKDKKIKNVAEIEEGELSDSESEAIESIYGSLVVVEKNKLVSMSNKGTDKEKPRKIQICLVINSEKTKPACTNDESNKNPCIDTSDFETFNAKKIEKNNEKLGLETISSESIYDDISNEFPIEDDTINKDRLNVETKISIPEIVETAKQNDKVNEKLILDGKLRQKLIEIKVDDTITKNNNKISESVEISESNIFNPGSDETQEEMKNEIKEGEVENRLHQDSILADEKPIDPSCKLENVNTTEEIPLLEPTKQVSEIDILQALKKEILSETTNVLNSDTKEDTLTTPLLHQPKITKVANAQEIGSKKRISIESYKAKSVTSSKSGTRSNTSDVSNKEDVLKKQSLKLTEKECERFNFLSKLTLTESSDDEDRSSLSLDECTDFAPKSPDHEDFADTGLKPPVIIPNDRVQTVVVGSETDVDMRKLLPNIKSNDSNNEPVISPMITNLKGDKESSTSNERLSTHLVDPRMKRDINSGAIHSPNPHSVNNEPRPASIFNTSTPSTHSINMDLPPSVNINSNANNTGMMIPMQMLNLTPNMPLNIAPGMTQSVLPNMTCPLPNMTPSRTPNAGPNIIPKIPLIMTPSRVTNVPTTPNVIGNMTPSMTPSRHMYECDDFSSPKHVYAPMFTVPENRDGLETPRDNRQTEWNYSDNQSSFWDDGNSRNSSTVRDVDYRDTRNSAIPKDMDFRDRRNQSMQRDIDYRDSRNNSFQSSQSFDTRDSESMQFSSIPNNSYGLLDCPPTPTASFGILEMPMTPIHSFGRLDCPSTPSHPFGRPEPLLPTPCLYNNQSVSRSYDSRFNRSSDYESNHYRDDDRERNYFRERKFNSGNPYHSDQNRHNSNTKFRRFRDQSVGRNERNKNFETVGWNYRDQTQRRETSVGRSYNRIDSRSFNREYEDERYSKSRSNCGNRGHDYRNHNDSKNRREKSVGRTFSKESFTDSMRQKESKCSENHKMNVERHGGHSFTINTSIKSTFQNTNSKRKSTSSFDSRRQRASSVGRTLHTSCSNRASNRETKEIFSESHMKTKNNNFRRACSVGREIVDDKLDFTNTKADLRSFKFKSDFTFSHDKFKMDVKRVSLTKDRYFQNESEKNSVEVYDKCNSKYSPRKNNRDPRIRSYKRDDKDYRSNSQESKNYGLVYSNDNISKGTILGSGYGVKNYKIPKIKRQEVTDVSKTSGIENIEGGNKSSESKDKSSDSKQKDLKIDIQVELDMSEKFDEKDNNVVFKNHKSKHIKDATKSIKKNKQKEKNTESCETDANSSQVNPIKTTKPLTRTRKSKKNEFLESNICQVMKNDDDDNKEERKDTDTNTDTMSDSSEVFERRLTRSARKNMSEQSKTMEISPVKKTRTLRKKPNVLESDSEDDKLNTIKTLNTGQQKESSQNILISSSKQSSNKDESSVEEKDISERVVLNTTQDLLQDSEEKSSISTLKVNEQAGVEVGKSTEKNAKFELILRNENLLHSKSNTVEKDKNTDDDLDSISEIDDLEMFPDNITSDPVIDSINDLIANLDHDLDSSKSVEINSHFTKELSLETMLENLTSPDKNDKKEIINDFTLEPELSDKHQARVIEIDKPKIESNMSIKNHMYKNPIEYADTSLNLKKYDSISTKEDESENEISQNIQKVQSGSSAILSSPSNPNDDVQNREIGKVKVDKELESHHDKKLRKNILNQQVHINEIDAEDTCSNEAIVSTSDDGNVCQTKTMFKTKQIVSKTNENVSSTPDSTITSEDNLEPNSGLNNSESTCEMNSDITSTHVADAVDKDSLDVLTSGAGPSTQIESIGKLLSILQDKTKIKELLSLLGNQTAENEKIKKKLEKLSEIVSDDESIIENYSGPISVATNISSISEKQEDSVLEEAQDAKELNEVGSKNQNADDGNDNTCSLRDCSNLNQKEKSDEMKNVNEDDSKEIKYECSEQTQSGINNMTNTEDVAKEFPVQENKIPAVPDKLESDLNEPEDQQNSSKEGGTTTAKKNVVKKKGSRRAKKRNTNKPINMENRRSTRSDVNSIQQTPLNLDKPVRKKPSRELQKLHEDMREMFLKDDILSATGIRMCRIAKLVDETKVKEDQSPNEINYQEPLVVLKKCNDLISPEKGTGEKILKKKMTKSKSKFLIMNKSSDSKKSNIDPYDFDTDSINEPNNVNDTKNDSSSDSESDSGGSNKSIESTELLAEMKKKVKRKRGKGWKAGIIKPKNKKKKREQKATVSVSDSFVTPIPKLPDFTCFTDRNYCFRKNVSTYNCRICLYNGTDIVHHYKKEHPHTEVPLSRMSPAVAREAIKESEDGNFQAISKICSKKYVCRFCYKEFGRKKRLLETFFWHIVSIHTGEYKQICSKCTNTQKCPLDIDIPPPPKDAKGQLLGYICEKCNYTQISLENLKTHVIVWHNDEQTAVYTVNLAFLSRAAMIYLLKNCDQSNYDMEQPRVLRSSRSNQSMTEVSNDESDASLSCSEESSENTKSIPQKNETDKTTNNEPVSKEVDQSRNIQSKITFENDITDEISHYDTSDTKIKVESDTSESLEHTIEDTQIEKEKPADNIENTLNVTKPIPSKASDVFEHPHFKVNYTETGAKEYICCINGEDKHYKTTLLISLKKHVQLKHSEKWDGYCCLCKVIVTPQGEHPFKDCLQHLLDKHIDNFPILVEPQEQSQELNESSVTDEASVNSITENKSYINVRPISELISTPYVSCPEEKSNPILPVIESVISFGSQIEQSHPSPSYPASIKDNVEIEKIYKYEEFQADIMSRKHRVVLESMMSHTKLVQVFKCAGRFCSFTSDSAENALLHASTHMRVGGVDSLSCAYCDFDSSGNGIDLITHVFKNHGCCQYVCGMCFYRAAASQQVNAHIKRVHDKATNVAILKTQFQTAPIREDNILSREAAVPLYLCCDKSGPEPCKFRTYTPGKFCEHLQLRHASATEHFCSICSTSSPTPGELIRHLKTHGLKLYQCTWCVFGADNEAELMAHASAVHPAKQPKAYLRIITNKEGSTELRVLPLAQLNKSDLPVTEVAPNYQKDFPVREAERSIDLEKLIGHTNLMIESMSTSTETDANEKEPKANIETPAHPEKSLGTNTNNLGISEMTQEIPRMSTPSPSSNNDDQFHKQTTPIIKTETLELTPEKIPNSTSDIVCLDSDDDTTDQNLLVLDETNVNVNTSLESLPSPAIEFKKVRLTELFVCPKCKMIIKCGSGFKKHINACYAGMSVPIPCVHCNTFVPKRTIVSHYNKHCDKESRYFCQECNIGFSYLTKFKEHQLYTHNTSTLKLVSPQPTKGRRKRSLDTRDKSTEPPDKVKRYGPQDIDKLPINPILDDVVVCSLCEFNTKVRLNMVRHLQLHAQQQPVPQTAPVNPVPHLETNEKHFDKMLNLASSSIVTRATDKNAKTDSSSAVVLTVPPEALSRYPKFVPEKQRLTCGAKDCSYISVEESMFKCHWETLHSDTSEFHCVHCPSYQYMDTVKPLTASRIVAHLKMHDDTLYACSLCPFYHNRRLILEKHLLDVHKGGQIMTVRDNTMAQSNIPVQPSTSQAKTVAPTMDLKPWQCGLCRFKSLLRPEVVDHCAKEHNSKMQYKCAYCAFRTSNPENITKHQTKSHVGKAEEIFYYYYREGSVSDEADGTTRWQKQSQNIVPSEPKVKSEDPSELSNTPTQKVLPLSKPVSPVVDLNLVKKETLEPIQETIEDLCKDFGEFCEPNGLKYKCSLCSNVTEDTAESMQSHLYEELKYRKWGCGICSYKAFHKEGLKEHMRTEHFQNRDPIALPVDNRVETWVFKLLEHQTALINKYKENLAIQKEEILRVNPGPSAPKPLPQQAKDAKKSPSTSSPVKPSIGTLEKIFGDFGTADGTSFKCPKCNITIKEECDMKRHLETELNKIRWLCSSCCLHFQTYHEAQFHCRSVHIGQSTRPMEVTRDGTVRLAWLETVIRVQKVSINLALQSKSKEKTPERTAEAYEPPENSLLVVRYEENIPTPEEEMARKTPAHTVDSDDEKLVIDEPSQSRKTKRSLHTCAHCPYETLQERLLRDHLLRHYGLKPYTCPYCGINGARKTIEKHQKTVHPTLLINLVYTTVPKETPSEYANKYSSSPSDATKVICLVCRSAFTEIESQSHVHDKNPTAFGKRGQVVVQCSVCYTLHKDVNAYFKHHNSNHPNLSVNYVFNKLNTINYESKGLLYACSMCTQKFPNMKDIKTHADGNHQSILKYTLVPKYNVPIIDLDLYDDKEGAKRMSDDVSILPPSKRTARKSTTKLPVSRSFARKSTTKLPYDDCSEIEEFSYYGTNQSNDDSNLGVVTMMPFCNKMVPFTLDRLREIININPSLVVEKIIIDELTK